MQYIIPDEIYHVAKWLAALFLPALAVLIATVGPAWGLANVDAIVLTINAIATFLGAIIGVSAVTAKGGEDADR